MVNEVSDELGSCQANQKGQRLVCVHSEVCRSFLYTQLSFSRTFTDSSSPVYEALTESSKSKQSKQQSGVFEETLNNVRLNRPHTLRYLIVQNRTCRLLFAIIHCLWSWESHTRTCCDLSCAFINIPVIEIVTHYSRNEGKLLNIQFCFNWHKPNPRFYFKFPMFFTSGLTN